MKKIFIIISLFFYISISFSVNVSFQPHQIVQPDGTVLNCFVSGDEFFNWLHDEKGYSIIKGKNEFWYYYAIKSNDEIVASQYKVGKVNPSEITSLKTWTIISVAEYKKRKEKFFSYPKPKNTKVNSTGIFNNIVIYIRFAGETEITETRNSYDTKLNNSSGNSLKSYFKEVSYNQLTINSTHYPECPNPQTSNLSYQDIYPRSYYQPYDAVSNPNGYNSNQRTEREHKLLKNAIDWININSPIPNTLNIDNDNDGMVDNVCFMIKGNSDAWANLLWAHRWYLFAEEAFINGKRVMDFTFQPQNQVNWRTICHEMFHAIGAPDLYHYSYDGIVPAGNWDIMETGSGHMGAYMKWKYANQQWVQSIPEITTTGQYWLYPLTQNSKNCYKIKSPNSTTEYFVLEYRKRIEGTYENNVPNSGILVYRINTLCDGNADGPPDEVYIYRPSTGGINNAHFSSNAFRTLINDNTNPASLLSNGQNGKLNIFNISAIGDSISFNFSLLPPAPLPQLTLTPSPQNGGVVTGSGTYNIGQTAIAKAIPNLGWELEGWFENNNLVSVAYNFAFSFQGNRNLTAKFFIPQKIDETNLNLSKVSYNSQENKLNFYNFPNNNYNIKIFDLSGKLIYQTKMLIKNNEIIIKNINNGIYILDVENDDLKYKQKISIIK